ncbi:MAG: xanthine dehydrogenase family protein molybdopterin-binding subunit, partial [Acidobacteria bacterium]|nr:xanthine dehydrogenase family protein molybdopterin-binding subunit [Acidobacteriota bacterium]
VYVRSTVAHGRIVSIDTNEALELPGVVAIYTANDLDSTIEPPAAASGFVDVEYTEPFLAGERVRYVGETIAAVLAETAAQATDAAEAVSVDIETLEAIVDPVAAASPDAVQLFDAGNVAFSFGDDDVKFDPCYVVVTSPVLNQRVAACPIEGRVIAVEWEGDHLTVYASTQGAHPLRDTLADTFSMPPEQVRVVSADVGGGFGAKGSPHTDEVAICVFARMVGRPVLWAETRTENMLAMVQGRAQHQTVTLGGTADGDLTHYRLEIVQDCGAYAKYGALLPTGTAMMSSGCYDLGNIAVPVRSVLTNTTPVSAYRGAGRPEAAAALERALDLFAAETGIDPAELRRRNFHSADDFPWTTATNTTYDSGDYEAALDKALEAADYSALRAEQEARREQGDTKLLGIGLASYVEITAFGGGGEYTHAELKPDGRFVIQTGSNPYGQGHHTTWAQIAATELAVDIDDVEIVHGDTDVVAEGSSTGGSRSVQLSGSAVQNASVALVGLAKEGAAELLEAAVDDVVLDADAGGFHVVGTPARVVTWADVAADTTEPLTALSTFHQEGETFPFGTHLSVVEVDSETGAVEMLRHIAVDDAGTIVNPIITAGQVHGGFAQGAAQALLEQVIYDDDGTPRTTNFADYSIISATELPLVERVISETPTPRNPLGAKGIGEAATIGSTPAIQNAVIDAVSHLGIRHIDMPCTPERVWSAIRVATS